MEVPPVIISMGCSEINHPASDQGTPMTWEPLLYIYICIQYTYIYIHIYWNILESMLEYIGVFVGIICSSVTYIGILEQYWSILLEYMGISKGNR